MGRYRVFFSEPKFVDIEANSKEEAHETFMMGEFNEVFDDRDAGIDGPNLILWME